MAKNEQLSDVLGEFARTLLTDFPIQAILDQLVERIVDVMPVTAAGVTLISPGQHLTMSRHRTSRRFASSWCRPSSTTARAS